MPHTPIKSRREEYAEATREALFKAGRQVFAELGYRDAGVEVISRSARVTRGAFYHHFSDKKALFDAVVVSMQAQAADRIERRARSREAIWDRLEAGVEAFLDACLEADYRRIVIQEAPVVLGDGRFREIEEQYPMALLAATLEALKRRGQLAFDDVGLLTRMVDALICELAVTIPEAADAKHVREQGQAIINTLLNAYRIVPSPA